MKPPLFGILGRLSHVERHEIFRLNVMNRLELGHIVFSLKLRILDAFPAERVKVIQFIKFHFVYSISSDCCI